MFWTSKVGLTLFQAGSGTYVTRRGGAIMARIDLRRHRFTQRPPTTLNLLPDKYFDLWLSIDTQNSPLCGILLRLRAVKWRWSKMKIFKRKKVEISNFGLQKCYIPQKKAENIYNKDSARKSKISCKKNIFFFDFSVFCLMLEDPRKFLTPNFPTFSKKISKNGLSGICLVPKGTKSWILVSLALFLRKRQTVFGHLGHNAPPPCKIGLKPL